MDSLWNIWIDKGQTVDSKAKALEEYSNAYLKINEDSALHFADILYQYIQSNDLIDQENTMTVGFIYYRNSKYEQAIDYFNEALILSRNNGDSSAVAKVLNKIGVVYFRKTEYDIAYDYYKRSITLMKSLGDKKGEADLNVNIGIIHIIRKKYIEANQNFEKSIQLYSEINLPKKANAAMINYAILKRRQGDYAGAIALYMKSLAINEELNDKRNIASIYYNVGTLYYNMNDSTNFFKYLNKSLVLRRELKDKRGITASLTYLGVIYSEYHEHEKALRYFKDALKLAIETEDKNNIANIKLNSGFIYIETQKYKIALDYVKQSFAIFTQLQEIYGISRAHRGFGKYYEAIGDNNKAEYHFKKGLEIAEEADIKISKDFSEDLYKLYKKQEKNGLALEAYQKYIVFRDSIQNEENQKEFIRQEYKYTYEKKALADSLSFETQKEIQKTKLEKSTTQQRFLLVIVGVILLFIIILYRRNTLIKKQNITIEKQNSSLTQLTDDLKGLNENLEHKVEERTAELTKVNKELKESDERYGYALDASNDGIWDYDVKDDIISFSPAIFTMLGFQPYEFPETREGIYNLLHSDEKKLDDRKIENLFIPQKNQGYLEEEYRLIGKNGKVIWVQIKGKIVEKDKNEAAIRIVGTHTNITASKLRNKEMLEAILRTEDAERSRISKEIHDGLQQTLIISFMNFRHFKKKMKISEGKEKETFDLGWSYLERSVEESREVAHRLMPKSIVDYGVLSACNMLIDDMNKSINEIQFDFHHNLISERLPNQQIEITLYRILQECLNNIIKYAKATEVNIQLYDYENVYTLTVEDNGVGFDTKILESKKGLGFQNIKNRLDAINGSLEVDSQEGQGTTIIVEISKSI